MSLISMPWWYVYYGLEVARNSMVALDWPEMASFLVFSEESVILLEHWISIYSSSKIG